MWPSIAPALINVGSHEVDLTWALGRGCNVINKVAKVLGIELFRFPVTLLGDVALGEREDCPEDADPYSLTNATAPW
jgi:hypothetical protein